MDNYTKEEKEKALEVIVSAIGRCQKVWPKFKEGSSQHTLLKNRINALYIAKTLIAGEEKGNAYGKEELVEALAPIASISSKCEKARLKFEKGSSHYIRFSRLVDAMEIAKAFLVCKIGEL